MFKHLVHRSKLLLPWFRKKLIPRIFISIISLVILLGGGELFLRLKYPFNKTVSISKFDKRYGWNFKPGSIVQLTNHVDFWTSTNVNSIGFLDHEPPDIHHPGIHRIIFMGDSIVEAAQVPIEKKCHVLFETMANRTISGQRFDTVALGYSGTGQANQLPFYDVFARPLHPDVIILVFVSNDFANNSAVLESVRNGWHPLHPPRLFFQYDKTAGSYIPIPIDLLWFTYTLPPLEGECPQSGEVVSFLKDGSYLFNWFLVGLLKTSHNQKVREWANRLNGNPPSLARIYLHRMTEIERLKGFEGIFQDWKQEEIDIDAIFATEKLPHVCEEAVSSTGYALDEFQARSQRDGFKLIILAAENLSTMYNNRRKLYTRLTTLAFDRGIPVIDMYEYISSKGGSVANTHFRLDNHWNEQGHQWAAEAVLQYYQTHPEIYKKE